MVVDSADSLGPPPPPPSPPSEASIVLGPHVRAMERFAAILADTGVSHGLLGPREVPRLWDRHLLNCAVIGDAFPHGAWVLDIGSGAGLPGLALAITRPDLRLTLIEPMLRRTAWLETAVGHLGLSNVEVCRGRAEDLHGRVQAPYATARAVARLDKLARWAFPLLSPGGTLVAMKGSSVHTELVQDAVTLRRLGMASGRVTQHGTDVLAAPVLTADLVLEESAATGRRRSRHR